MTIKKLPTSYKTAGSNVITRQFIRAITFCGCRWLKRYVAPLPPTSLPRLELKRYREQAPPSFNPGQSLLATFSMRNRAMGVAGGPAGPKRWLIEGNPFLLIRLICRDFCSEELTMMHRRKSGRSSFLVVWTFVLLDLPWNTFGHIWRERFS